MKKISACTLDCQDSCSTIVKVHPDTGEVSISGNPEHPFTRGFLCKKGKNAYQRNNSAKRITTPLIRRGGEFHEADWDTALDLVANELKALAHDPAAILHVRYYGYRGILAEAGNYLFNALGASSTRGALCDDAGCTAYMADFGGIEMNDPLDLLNARHIINWGKDFSRSSIHLEWIVKQARKNGCRLTTISPGDNGSDALSDTIIRVRPGRDRFLAAAVIKEILHRGLAHGPALLQARGMEEFQSLLDKHSRDTLLRACDCSRQDLEHLVHVFTQEKKYTPEDMDGPAPPQPVSTAAQSKTAKETGPDRAAVALIMGWGIQRYRFGGETVRHLNALSFLAGHVGRSGGGTYYNISSGRNLNTSWVEKAGKPARTLLLPRIGHELLNARPSIKFLLADGTNFVNQAPDSGATIKAMAQIPFKVVIDAFMTDTAARADVILPCALNHEREDLVGSCLHNYVNHAAPVFASPGMARSDFDIMSGLAARLAIDFPDKDDILRNALDTPFMENPAVALETVKTKGFVMAAHPKIAWENLCFAHPDGKYRLPATLSEEPAPPPGYPMHLLSLVNRDYIHSQIPEADQTGSEKGLLSVWINGAAPHLGEIDPEQQVYLATPLGRIPVQVKTTPHLHPGTLVIRRGGWLKHGRCVNLLIEDAVTDMGETAAYYSQYARLENQIPRVSSSFNDESGCCDVHQQI